MKFRFVNVSTGKQFLQKNKLCTNDPICSLRSDQVTVSSSDSTVNNYSNINYQIKGKAIRYDVFL